MTPERIQYRLKRNKTTQAKIARQLKVSDMSVSDVINKKRVSDRIMTAVAEAVGMPKERVFPEYYKSPRQRRTSKSYGPAAYAA